MRAPAPPRETAYIELRNQETGDSWSGKVSDKGLFGLKDNELRPGTYQAVLYGAPDWIITRIVAQNAKVQGSQITLAAGASAKLVCTATRVSASVTGTVLQDDKPFAGAMVLLVPDDGLHDKQRYRRDESDSDGTFTLRQVVPGRYTAIAIQNGWNLEWGDPAVLNPYLEKGEKVTVTAEKSREHSHCKCNSSGRRSIHRAPLSIEAKVQGRVELMATQRDPAFSRVVARVFTVSSA